MQTLSKCKLWIAWTVSNEQIVSNISCNKPNDYVEHDTLTIDFVAYGSL